MELRQIVDKNRVIVTSVAIIGTLLALFILIRQSSGVGASSGIKAYFSSDDGKTWFKDEITRTYPFDHDGQPAYRAIVFRCGETVFCGYLQSMPDKVKEGIDALPPNWQARYAAIQSASDSFLVKKPGDARWVHPGQKHYAEIIKPVCPDGSGQPPVPLNANTD
jgi:hypothetical protein